MTRKPLALLAVIEAVLIVLLVGSMLSRDEVVAKGTESHPGEKAGVPEVAPPVEPPAVDAPTRVEAASPVRTDTAADPSRPSPEGAVLFGHISTSDGGPVPQGGLVIRRVDAASSTPSPRLTFGRDRTDFAMPGLLAGSYELTIGASGYRNRSDKLEIPDGSDRVEHDIVMQKTWDLRVLIVTPDERPLWEVIAEERAQEGDLMWVEIAALATIAPPPSPIPGVSGRIPQIGIGHWNGGTQTIADGRPRPPKRYAGVLELPVDVPLYVSAVLRSAVLATERVEPGQEEVRLVVTLDQVRGSLCTVRMQLVDAASGSPASGASVTLRDSQSSGLEQPVDAEGRVVCRSRPGKLQLELRSPGSAASSYDLELLPGTNIDLGSIPVSGTAPAQVNFTFEGIAAGTDLTCWVRSIEPLPGALPDPLLRARWNYVLSNDGHSASSQLRAGRHELRATAGQHIARIEFDTRALGDKPVVVRLEPGAVLHVIPPPLDRPVGLTIIDGAGAAAWKRQINWATGFDVTLFPGAYVAEVTSGDGTIRRQTLALTVGTTELDLR